jgi:rifampin ADP-ribosylating transferase
MRPSPTAPVPVRIVGEVVDWVGRAPEQVQGMRDGVERLRPRGESVIDD